MVPPAEPVPTVPAEGAVPPDAAPLPGLADAEDPAMIWLTTSDEADDAPEPGPEPVRATTASPTVSFDAVEVAPLFCTRVVLAIV